MPCASAGLGLLLEGWSVAAWGGGAKWLTWIVVASCRAPWAWAPWARWPAPARRLPADGIAELRHRGRHGHEGLRDLLEPRGARPGSGRQPHALPPPALTRRRPRGAAASGRGPASSLTMPVT